MIKEKDIKENLRRIRKEAKLSQEQVAEKMGIQRSTYRNIESGDTRIISDSIAKFAEALNIDEDLILGYDLSRMSDDYLTDIRNGFEKRVSELMKENERLCNEINRLKAENSELKENRRFMEGMVAWLKERLDKANVSVEKTDLGY